MNLRSFIYRLIGMFWFMVGLVVGGLGIAYLIILNRVDTFIGNEFPFLVPITSPLVAMLESDWLIIWAILFGLLCVLVGINLAILKSWIRPIAIVFHLLLAIFILILTLVLYLFLTDLSFAVPEKVILIVCGVGLGITILCVLIGTSFFSEAAQDTFAGGPLDHIKAEVAKCPTCEKNNLNLQSGLCPLCDAEHDIVAIVAARLISLDSGESYPVSFRRKNTIGRFVRENDIVLSDSSISQPHAQIECDEGRFFVFDLGSSNGTFVGGKRIRFSEIFSGNEIRFGISSFKFEVDYAR